MANGFQFREVSTGRYRGAGGRFIPNPVGIKALEFQPGMEYMLKQEAEKVVEAAKQLARSEAYESGDYYNGLRAAAGIETATKKMSARANAFDYKSHWIEWGTARGFPARHILERAAEAVGYQVAASVNARRISGRGTERVRWRSGR